MAVSHVFAFVCIISSVLDTSTFAFTFSRKTKPCGQSLANKGNREAKIVGGFVAAEGEFPWVVSFKSKLGHFCGGTVISDKYILSASHCFHRNEYLVYKKDGSVDLTSVNVTLGEYSLKNSSESSEVMVNVKKIYLHPKYDPVKKENDIALIKIAKTIAVAPTVAPVCLPSKIEKSTWKKDTKAIVVGWGKSKHNQDYYDWVHEMGALRKVSVKIWDKNDCIDKYKSFPQFPSNSFICAGEQGRESCTGDSGGPLLMLNENNRWEAIGVVANGHKCGSTGRPGIYTMVSDFMKWIESYTR